MVCHGAAFFSLIGEVTVQQIAIKQREELMKIMLNPWLANCLIYSL